MTESVEIGELPSEKEIKVLLLFLETNIDYIRSLSKLTKILGVSSSVTAKKSIKNLLRLGILNERDIGKSKAIKINKESPYLKLFQDFFGSFSSNFSNEQIANIFERNSTKILFLFLKNKDYLNNINGLADILNISTVTVRKHVDNLVNFEILSETILGKSRAIRLNGKGYYTNLLYSFFESFEEIKKRESRTLSILKL